MWFFLMWILLKINVDISWSVIAKCTKGPLMSTHSACENVFTKQLIELLLILSGDVELNFIKVSLLHTLAITNDYDIIYLIETFLDPSIDNDDKRISIPGFNTA